MNSSLFSGTRRTVRIFSARDLVKLSEKDQKTPRNTPYITLTAEVKENRYKHMPGSLMTFRAFTLYANLLRLRLFFFRMAVKVMGVFVSRGLLIVLTQLDQVGGAASALLKTRACGQSAVTMTSPTAPTPTLTTASTPTMTTMTTTMKA